MKDQRKRVIAILLLLLLPLVTAEEHLTSNTTYTSGQALELQAGEHVVYVGAGNVTTMKLEGANETTFLQEGECTRKLSEKVCYEAKEGSAVRLALLDMAADVEVTLTLNESGEMDMGDVIEATIWMNNSGESDTEQARMTLPLPENLTIIEIDDCTQREGNITWEGTLRSDDGESCTARLRVDGTMDATLQATINYTSYGENLYDESEEHELSAQAPFTLRLDVSRTQMIEPGQPIALTITITTEDEDNNISINPLELTYDEGLRFLATNAPHARNREGRVTARATISTEDNLTATYKLIPLLIGDEGELSISFTYNTTKDGTQRTFYKTYTYTTNELALIIGIEPADPTFESYREGKMNITVTNPYRHFTFKGYDVEATFSLTGEKERARVPYSRSRRVLSIPYLVPDLDHKRQEHIEVSVVAKTEAGQAVETHKTFDVTILPLQEVVLEKTIETRKGDVPATIITLYATNQHQANVTVTVHEELPAGLFARGDTEKSATLAPGERTLIYEYELLATDDLPEGTTSTTAYTYTYLGHNIEQEQETDITATTYHAPEPQEDNVTRNESIPPPPTTPERQRPSLIHIIIAAGLLLIIVTGAVAWEWVRHLHAFRIKHKTLLKEYQSLMDQSELLRKRKEALNQEQKLMSKKLDIVEHHLGGYDDRLPEKIEDLEKRKKDVKLMEAVLKERHESLRKRIDELKQKEETIKRYEHDFEGLLARIEGREQGLKKDDDLLHEDLKTLKEDQEALTRQLDDNLKRQQLMKDRIAHFKAKHAANLNMKMRLLATRKQRAKDYHEQLEREEARIKNEFSKMQDDLAFSKEDLQRAEKLYKQAGVQLRKGEHEEQAAHEE